MNQYNEYFNEYNNVISTCINYHASNDTDDDDGPEHGNDIEATSPISRDTTLESGSNKKDTHQNSNQKTVCKNPLEIPEQQTGDAATEILYSQSANADVTNKRYVSAIEIPMGTCKNIHDKSPIGTCIDIENIEKTSIQTTCSKEHDTLHVYTHNHALNDTEQYFENVATKHPVYERIHYNMHNHDNLEIESAQLQKSDGKYYAHDTTPPARHESTSRPILLNIQTMTRSSSLSAQKGPIRSKPRASDTHRQISLIMIKYVNVVITFYPLNMVN